MSDKELHAVHARIAELEALLQGQVRKPLDWRKVSVPLAALAIAAVVALSLRLTPTTVTVMVPPPRVEVVPDGALVLADNAPPALAEHGDKSYAIVRGWRTGANAPLYVVAFDRSDWKVAWRSSGHPAAELNRGHLTVSADRVVFTDSTPKAFVLGLQTGVPEGEYPLESRITQMYMLDPNSVMLSASRVWTPREQGFVLDLAKGKVRDEEHVPRAPACPSDRTKQCMESGFESKTTKALYPNGDHVRRVSEGATSFLLISERVGVGPGVREHALVLSADGTSPAWRGPLAPPSRVWQPWPNTAPEGLIAFANRRIYYLYEMMDGERRVSTRDYGTGKILYDVAIPGLRYGSKVDSLTADENEAFIVANDSLFVLDGSSGAVKHRINSF